MQQKLLHALIILSLWPKPLRCYKDEVTQVLSGHSAPQILVDTYWMSFGFWNQALVSVLEPCVHRSHIAVRERPFPITFAKTPCLDLSWWTIKKLLYCQIICYEERYVQQVMQLPLLISLCLYKIKGILLYTGIFSWWAGFMQFLFLLFREGWKGVDSTNASRDHISPVY